MNIPTNAASGAFPLRQLSGQVERAAELFEDLLAQHGVVPR